MIEIRSRRPVMTATPDARRDDHEPPTYAAEDVRQGEIILRTKPRRAVFVAGLIGCVLLALILGIVV